MVNIQSKAFGAYRPNFVFTLLLL